MSTLSEGRLASQSRWEIHQQTLRQLYLVEKKTLKQVQDCMEKSYNFKATESQYEHAFREWGFEKNLKKPHWTAIDYHTSKRKRCGKESEVLHNGVAVPPKKIRKEILRNRRTVSPRREGAQTPNLPDGVTIRTPAAILTDPEEVLECCEISDIEDITFSGVNDHFSNPLIFNHPSNEISNSADRDMWAESYDLRDHIRSDLQRTVKATQSLLTQSPPHRYLSSQYFDEYLLDQGFDSGLQELENFGACQIYNPINPESSTFYIETSDIFRNTYDATAATATTATTRQDYISASNWGGKHSRVLHNVPWFRFQQIVLNESFGSGSSAGHTLQSSTHGFELSSRSYSPVQDSLAIEERQLLLSGFFNSVTTLNGLETHAHFTSLLQDLVPERFDGEISNKIRHFFDPLNKQSLYQLAEFYLYFLSNNKFTQAQTDSFLEWITRQKPIGLLKELLQMKTPTTQVFSNNILEFTVRCGKATNLQLLIGCGIDRSLLSGVVGGKYLQLALSYGNLDIAELLMENEVNMNPPTSYIPYDEPPLSSAVYWGYTDMTRRLIDAGANLQGESVIGETALAHGLRQVHPYNKTIDCIRLLLEAGANVDNDEIEDLPLLDWLYLNNIELYHMVLPRSQVVKRSLTLRGILFAASKGRQVLSQYLDGMQPIEDWERQYKLETSLCQAANHTNQPIEVVRVLLEFGVDPNVVTVSETFGAEALRKADFGNSLAVVKLLLSSGADINDPAVPRGGQTLLQAAVRLGNIRTVKYMIDQGADINAPPSHSGGFTALQVATITGNMEVVEFLLSLGADIHSAPSRSGGKTVLEAPADCRVPSRRAELFQIFLDQRANINRSKRQRKYRNWNSALTTLVKNSAGDELIRSALSAGADVNELGHGEGARTAVQAAAEVGDIAIVQLLLDNGANINAPPSKVSGRTALQAACSIRAPKIELVKLLLDNGADVNFPAGFKQGLTSIQGAAIQGHIKIALMLLDAGVEVNTEPAAIDGRTALDGAAEHGRLDMVQLLLNLGAESENPGATGVDNAIRLAEKHGHQAIVDLLKHHSQQ